MWHATVEPASAQPDQRLYLAPIDTAVWGRLALTLLLLAAPTVNAQPDTAVRDGRCTELAGGACRTTLLTEATLSRQMTRERGFGTAQGNYLGVSVGLLRPVGPRVGVGVVATGGVLLDMLVAAGPRLRLQASRILTVDVTSQFVLVGGPGDRGHLLLDASVMAWDKLGMSLQVNWVDQEVPTTIPPSSEKGRQPIVHVGPRLGSTPGRFGMAAAIVAVATAVVVFATSDGWL